MTDIAPVIELPSHTLAEIRTGIEDLAALIAEPGGRSADLLFGVGQVLRSVRCGCASDLAGDAPSDALSTTLAEVRAGMETLAEQMLATGDRSAGVLLFAARSLWLVRCSCQSASGEPAARVNAMIAAYASSATRTVEGG